MILLNIPPDLVCNCNRISRKLGFELLTPALQSEDCSKFQASLGCMKPLGFGVICIWGGETYKSRSAANLLIYSELIGNLSIILSKFSQGQELSHKQSLSVCVSVNTGSNLNFLSSLCVKPMTNLSSWTFIARYVLLSLHH